jgi:hypothetical protein
VALPHEDIAGFLFGLDKLLGARRAGIVEVRQRASRTRLREAFLEGYGGLGAIDPRTPLERWVTRLFEVRAAVGMLRRRLRDREATDVRQVLGTLVRGQLWLRAHPPR